MPAALAALEARFVERFGRAPAWASDAGGRINLIGEHTDYHQGWVLPAAADLRTVALGAPRADQTLALWSEEASEGLRLQLGALSPVTPAEAGWQAYAAGPFWAAARAGLTLPGADVLVTSELPLGGGLASSAALQVSLVGLAVALAEPCPIRSPSELAQLALIAEREFCGVPCGPMDQLASACGAAGQLLLIDCHSLTIDAITLPPSLALVVADSGVAHRVAGGDYALRQRECQAALERLRQVGHRATSARQLSVELLDEERRRVGELGHRRLRHVVSENERVLAAAEALRASDSARLGELLCRSHASLAGDYEVSCVELDQLVEVACAVPGVHGARLMGAGFGGATVNLVEAARAEDIAGAIAEALKTVTGRPTTGRWRAPRVVRPSAGLAVRRLSPAGRTSQ